MTPSDDHDLQPGLPEAVDPATGNGAAWTADAHARALRHPDPLKLLDELTGPVERPPDMEKTADRHIPPKDETEAGLPPKEKPAGRKVKAGKRVKKAIETLREMESEAATPAEPGSESIPAETRPSLGHPAAINISPMGLSPFVTWLKGLSGSEYVHPYEEDQSDLLDGTHQEVASETLADLLARQGYTDRAIGMYESLMLKFPEKSSFFAAKIKALQ